MAKVNQKFIGSYLNNKLMEAVKNLHDVKSALDPDEKELIKRLDELAKQITSIEL